MSDPLLQVEKLIAHAKQVEGAEQAAALALADGIMDEYAAHRREQKIVSVAVETIRRGGILERFRTLLSLAEGEGSISPAGRQLLELARSAPAVPKGDYSKATDFYAWHRDNSKSISALIEKI
jgi:hypothetical protein